MSERLYVDANVWIALWKDERSETGGPDSEVARRLVAQALECRYSFVTSERVGREIILKFPEFDAVLSELFTQLHSVGKLEVVEVSEDDILEAETLNLRLGIGVTDCLHLLLAFKHGVRLVTWDARLRREANVIGQALTPDDLRGG